MLEWMERVDNESTIPWNISIAVDATAILSMQGLCGCPENQGKEFTKEVISSYK